VETIIRANSYKFSFVSHRPPFAKIVKVYVLLVELTQLALVIAGSVIDSVD